MNDVYKPNVTTTKSMVLTVYILYVCAYFTLVTGIVGAVIAYVKKDNANEKWLNDHFIWQINTFWVWFIVGIIGAILCFVLIGFVIIGIVFVWSIYRVVKGCIRYSEQRSPYA